MADRLKPFPRLEGDQQRASDPRHHAALSASAGTGKTHVLTARVLRLLLAGTRPESILCLTFTKAAAAEMAQRIHERLAYWVRLDTPRLRKDLFALGERNDPEAIELARTLFAAVLDAPGGGLRIQTIHAFAQGLLAAFPAEAGLVPGFRPLEPREQQMLARTTLADLLVRAEGQGDLGLVRDMQALSLRLGEAGAETYLMQCARAPDALAALGSREAIEARLRVGFDLPLGDIEEAIASGCCDDLFDVASLEKIAAANRTWGSPTGLNCCDVVAAWLASDDAGRSAALDGIAELVLTKAGDPRKPSAGLLKADPDYAEHAARLILCCQRLQQMRRTAALVKELAAALRAGQAFAAAYAEAKRTQGAADFDDLIRWAERLLLEPGMGDWVRYKLDQATDHILVDEAQDTNEKQWNIVRALALEYFAGEGASGRHRTIFTVGDYKQAIFGFQGTDPQSFDVARAWFDREAQAVQRDFLDLSMDRSFRSSPPILALVDQVIDELGHGAFGLTREPNRHESFHGTRPGSVTLWDPYTEEAAEDADEEEGEEGWVSDAVRNYATRLARQVKQWIAHPFRIESKGRSVRPEDILILVRRRGTLASLIVARLHAEGVPVAGVDRLLLTAPLAVQDLLAAARFAVQPLDDLNLAGLLVSPLFGWSQDELYVIARGREGALWPAVRGSGRAETIDGLRSILGMADYATPHQFLETILSGPLQGRRRLVERLGPEARDPIEELLSSAIEFEAAGTPTLQRFLDWFARGDVEIVRDPSAPLDAVRVMTVHGSKGLQSPVLILADACLDPQRQRGSSALLDLGGGDPVPIFRPRKAELAEPLKAQVEAQAAREREEHWRLLYVALTRAEERLYIGGALGPADRNGPPAESWYAAVGRAMAALGCERRDDPHWGSACRFGEGEIETKAATPRASERSPELPAWLFQSAPAEARPPRPFTPSAPDADGSADPPPTAAMRAAAERGRLLHRLFERMPGAAAEQRAALADAWLERAGGVVDAGQRRELVETAAAIIGRADLADLFGPGALAEAPIAAVTREGAVVSGTVDRLLVGADRIRLVDFKTGRAFPADERRIPLSHLRQMAAYVAALEVIFPDRPIEANLLYTAGPKLFRLDPVLLAQYRPGMLAPA